MFSSPRHARELLCNLSELPLVSAGRRFTTISFLLQIDRSKVDSVDGKSTRSIESRLGRSKVNSVDRKLTRSIESAYFLAVSMDTHKCFIIKCEKFEDYFFLFVWP